MIEIYVLSAAIVVLAVVHAFTAWLERKTAQESGTRDAEREKELLQIIRRLENRIHAKDVTTYHQLEKADREIPESPEDKAARLQEEARAHETAQAQYFAGNGHY